MGRVRLGVLGSSLRDRSVGGEGGSRGQPVTLEIGSLNSAKKTLSFTSTGLELDEHAVIDRIYQSTDHHVRTHSRECRVHDHACMSGQINPSAHSFYRTS